jgi:hypothetical protein
MNVSMNPVRGNFDPRNNLAEISLRLREVHESLVRALQVSFEKLHGRVETNGKLFELVLHDPLFAWLRPMSKLIAELDGLVDDPDVRVDFSRVDAVRNTIERWTCGTGEADEFADSYRVFLQAEPNVVMAHAALKQELAAIPRN